MTETSGFQNADRYEQLMGRWSRRLAPSLVTFGGLGEGDRVLDMGCGTGSLSFALPALANVGSAVGVDLTESYVAAARARNTDPRFTFDVGDARALPIRMRGSIVLSLRTFSIPRWSGLPLPGPVVARCRAEGEGRQHIGCRGPRHASPCEKNHITPPCGDLPMPLCW